MRDPSAPRHACSSMFAYCTGAVRSCTCRGPKAYLRVEVARAVRQQPLLFSSRCSGTDVFT